MGFDPQELEDRLGTANCPVIVDVRSRFEYTSGHIPGALHLPFLKYLFRASSVIPDKLTDVVLYCEHGPRAQLASSILGFLGYRSVNSLVGHMHRWRRDKRKLVK
jgi:hydroxyacylglutathione hydrolase